MADWRCPHCDSGYRYAHYHGCPDWEPPFLAYGADVTEDDIRYMQNPATAVIVPAESGRPNVFGLIIAFPKDPGEQSNVKLSIVSAPIKDHELHNPNFCKNFAEQVVDALQKRGRMDLVTTTNWASVTAAIQRLLNDWNAKRQAPTTRVQ